MMTFSSYRCFRTLIAVALLFAAAFQGLAESRPAVSNPLLPLPGISYRYWDEQIIQWLGPELPYSMFILLVDKHSKDPVYLVRLIERSSGDAIEYTNQEAELQRALLRNAKIHRTAMEFDGPEEPQKDAQYTLRFTTENGLPVLFQFIQGTDLSDQGSRVVPAPGSRPSLIFMEQGALAGQGTAMRIGNVTSTADVWKEFAQPPYFVPYHGALSEGVHNISFGSEDLTWTTNGNSLSSSSGTQLTRSHDGNTELLRDSARGTEAAYSLNAGEEVLRITFGPAHSKPSHTIALQFSGALTNDQATSFTLVAGKKKQLAAGKVIRPSETSGRQTIIWTLEEPTALHGSEIKASAGVLAH